MIRELESKDIEMVMDIWKEATIKAHNFIPKEYWIENYNIVKNDYIPLSKTFVYVEEDIKGFISILNDEFIGAVFVHVGSQGEGIGTALMEFVKTRYDKLSLAVYKNNKKSVGFYKKSNFVLEKEEIDDDTKEIELLMTWKK